MKRKKKKPSERARRYADTVCPIPVIAWNAAYNAYLAGWRAAKKEKR